MRNRIGFVTVFLALTCVLPSRAHASALIFNADTPADNVATRNAWLASIGITAPQYFVDFESGFTNNQNISGVPGLFPGGLTITDTSAAHAVTIVTGAGSIGGSNPIGQFAARQNEAQYLQFDFAIPVDYLAFQDIDQLGANAIITFVGGATQTFTFETTGSSGNSAEFIGIVRNNMPAIIRLQLDASGDGQWGVDNIQFGTVPEPATLTLVGAGVVATITRRRRRLSR